MHKTLFISIVLLAGCTMLSWPTKSSPSVDYDSLTVGQWYQVDTDEYRQGKGRLKSRYVGQVRRMDKYALNLSDVTVHMQTERRFSRVPYLNRLTATSADVESEQHESFHVPRFIITKITPLSPEEVTQLRKPIERIGVDFDVQLSEQEFEVD